MKNPNLVTRSAYSFFSSILKIRDIINFAISNNFKHVSLIERNVMFGALEFYLEAKKENLIPIIGIEVDYNNIHIILIAKNNEGYFELVDLSSKINQKQQIDISNYKNLISVFPNEFQVHSYLLSNQKDVLYAFATIGNVKISENQVELFTENEAKKHISTEKLNKISEIYAKIDIDLDLSKKYFPTFNLDISKEQLKKNLKNKLDSYLIQAKINFENRLTYFERFENEFTIIESKNLLDYFLVISDFIRFAKEKNIVVGPGRGSSVGSLVVFLLEITKIDPLKFNLLFERFLNLEREELPDIDVDIEDERRNEIIEYIISKYGKNNVAQIITFQTLKLKMSLRDIGRVLKISNFEVNEIVNNINEATSFLELENSHTFRNKFSKNENYLKIIEYGKLFENLPRQFSTHAAGVVISPVELTKIIPIIKRSEIEHQLSQYSMNYIDKVGLIKIDILGLRNLSFLKEVIALIENQKSIIVKVEKLNLDDKEVYKQLKNGFTSGIFQIESFGMKKVLMHLKVENFEELVACISLYRPGPSKNIDKFIERKFNKEKINYFTKSCENVLKPTYGIIVYQEQIMEIAKIISNFSLSKADILRKAISKKDSNLMEQLKNEFLDGAINNGYDKKTAMQIFELIYEFSNYGFNRSHAVSYATLTYQLTYLKTYYYLEFYTCLLSSIVGAFEKTNEYIMEAAKKGIKILQPNVNTSKAKFSIENNEAIRFGLLGIKGLGNETVKEIIKERETFGKFASFVDFVVRMAKIRLKKNIYEILIKSGALDEFNISKTNMIFNLEKIINYGNLLIIETSSGERTINWNLLEPITLVESNQTLTTLDNSFELLGVDFNNLTSESQSDSNERIEFESTLLSLSEHRTKNNKHITYISFLYNEKKHYGTLFSEKYLKYKNILKIGEKYKFSAHLNEVRSSNLIITKIVKL